MIAVFLALCWILKCHFVARMPGEVITKCLFLLSSMSEGCVNQWWKQISWKLWRSLEPYGMSLLRIVWKKTCHKWASWDLGVVLSERENLVWCFPPQLCHDDAVQAPGSGGVRKRGKCKEMCDICSRWTCVHCWAAGLLQLLHKQEDHSAREHWWPIWWE